MCRPTHFTVEYAINPWMKPGTVDKKKALQQWETLIEQLQSQEVKVEIIDQVKGLPDMVFAADQGITMKDKVLLSRFRYSQRQKETFEYKKWFKNHQYEIVEMGNRKLEILNYELSFEGGGESVFLGDKLVIGTGFRTTK